MIGLVLRCQYWIDLTRKFENAGEHVGNEVPWKHSIT